MREMSMMDDHISRQAAKNKKVYSEERHEYVIPVSEIDWLPSAQSESCEYCVLSLKANGWRGSAKIRYCPMCGRDLLVK